jgi:hypothetical protein
MVTLYEEMEIQAFVLQANGMAQGEFSTGVA